MAVHEVIGPADFVDAVAAHIETTATPAVHAVQPLPAELPDEPMGELLKDLKAFGETFTKPLDSIDLIDDNGRASGFNVYERNMEFLGVRGGLEHGAKVKPRTEADRLKLIAWLSSSPQAQSHAALLASHARLVAVANEAALLLKEINLGRLNVRKDFSLLNHHAATTKALAALAAAKGSL